LWKIGNLKEAGKYAAFALQIAGKSREETLEAQMVSGMIASFQKDYPAAERFFLAAYLLDPDNFGASNNLALALIEQKDEDKKTKALKYAVANVRATQQTQNAAQALSTYGWVQYKMKNSDEAERALRMSMNSGISADTAYYWACLQHGRGRDPEAIKFLELATGFKGPFAMRTEADTMLKDLKKEE
jgi:tetratricopeptide (TPR) repeat protein